MAFDRAYDYLRSKGYQDRVRVFEQSTATCELAAKALGCTEAEICKSMAFRNEDKAILILAAGDMKISSGKFKRTFGLKASMLTPDETQSIVGHMVGGVCPFGITEKTEVYLDISLQRFETVYPACGSDNSAVRLTPDELFTVSEAKAWVDVTNQKA